MERSKGDTSLLRVKVNRKNQIVIPAEARKRLGIGPGDNVILDIGKHSIVVIREPDNYTEAMRGLGKEIWADVNTDEWLQEERDSWEK